MKKILCLITLAVLCFLTTQAQDNKVTYDSVLAKKLNGTVNGMKKYVLVMLKSGTTKSTDKNVRDSVFRGHMKNINKLADEGKLIIAGPLGENDKSYEGIFVFNTDNMDEAKKLVETDPAVINKYLDYELYPWFCSAALIEVPSIHKRIVKPKP